MSTTNDALPMLLGNAPCGIETLIKAWECRGQRPWQQSEALYLGFGKKAIALGQPIMAFDMLREGRTHFPESANLAYTAALALARGGSTGHAADMTQHLIETVDRNDPLYIQVLSLAGRIAKDRWEKSPPGPEERAFATRAAACYRQAYELSDGDYFPGINAATMSVLSGQMEAGRRIARQVRNTCQTLQAASEKNDYWLMATLGEACLLLGNQQQAVHWYRQAMKLAGKNVGDIASIRRQVRLLADALGLDDRMFETLQVGRVVVFSGHMIDAPGRPVPRFPPELEDAVRAAIAEVIDRLNVGFGYASAACGADLLFLECLIERGAETHVMLPFQQDDFIQTSVAFAGATWVERFHQALDRATTVRCAVDEIYLGDDVLFEYTNVLNTGTAMLHAARLGTDLVAMGVFDSASAAEIGGTGSALDGWRRIGVAEEVIALDTLRKGLKAPPQNTAVALQTPATAVAASVGQKPAASLSRKIKTMLFADMVGFSKLVEGSAPAFVINFLGEVANVINDMAPAPVFKNTWGDGLFLVFDEVAAGADFALRLRDNIKQIEWTSVGLPEDTNIRMGLHAGPVFPGADPIIGQQNFFGSHVNMAARIEPITPPGAVYVSEQFASLLVASGATGFACDYMGNITLAKGFGVYPIYRLRRDHEIE